jgi:hypothetical protein
MSQLIADGKLALTVTITPILRFILKAEQGEKLLYEVRKERSRVQTGKSILNPC